MVVDVGGGTAEMAVISLGGVVAVQALRCGGFDFDASIQTYVRYRHGVAIGERTAEAVKMAIGSASPYEGEQQAEIRGREVATGRPKTVILSPLEVRGALRGQRRVDRRGGGRVPGRGTAGAGAGHHVRGDPPDRGRCAAAGDDPAPGRRHRRSRCTWSTPRSSAWSRAPGSASSPSTG